MSHSNFTEQLVEDGATVRFGAVGRPIRRGVAIDEGTDVAQEGPGSRQISMRACRS